MQNLLWRSCSKQPWLQCASYLSLLVFFAHQPARADTYDELWNECHYISQCSCSPANASVHLNSDKAVYGILNDWRIGNGQADFVQPGEASIGAIGLLYGYQRLLQAGRSTPALDSVAKTALSAFFWSWVRNSANRTGNGFPAAIAYNAAGNVISKGGGDARVTAEILIAMRKYCLLSPNGDRASYQSQEYAFAHSLADFANANLSSWTVDRSYAVAAFHGFANWAAAVGDNATSTYYHARAGTISGWITAAQDHGNWRNYFAYLNGGGSGVYNGGIDQTGFAPYEFNARPAGEQFAKDLSDWWDHGQAYNNVWLTVQTGTYAGGVHQWTPQTGTSNQVYPGSSLQLADVCWKIAQATG
ncbi:MAG: hypothetical protein ACREKL_13110, partial [Chthoniobacterales bacterium]